MFWCIITSAVICVSTVRMQLRFLICFCFIFTRLSHAFASPVCIGVGLCEQITNQSAMSLNITLWVKPNERDIGLGLCGQPSAITLWVNLLDNGSGAYAADLDGIVPCSVGDGSLVQLMIRRGIVCVVLHFHSPFSCLCHSWMHWCGIV